MAFQKRIDIPKELIEKFGVVPLMDGFEGLYLKQEKAPLPDMVSYYLHLCSNGDDIEIGDIHIVGKTIKEKYIKDGILTPIGESYDQHVCMTKDQSEDKPRYGMYGMTMAMMYMFDLELKENGIEKITCIIKDDNKPSLDLYNRAVGCENRYDLLKTRKVTEQGWETVTSADKYIYFITIDQAIDRMNKYKAVKNKTTLSVGQLKGLMGRGENH